MFEHEFQRKVLEELREIVRLLKPHHFTAVITQCTWFGWENKMAIGDITAGQTGTFAVELLENGSASTAAVTWTWTADASDVTVEPSSDSTSAVFTVPATETAASLTVTATGTAPDGTVLAPTLTVTITPGVVNVFTASITQTA